jgi:hypothetical protein
MTRDEAEAAARRQIEEEHQRELAQADERCERKIDEIVAVHRSKNPAQRKERESIDAMRREKQRERDASRPERERDRGRE